jgi:hypothetical protein
MAQTLKLNRTIEVFVSYAHEDEGLWNELSKHLSNLKRRNVISIWHHRQIGAGQEWKNEIDAHLNMAHIVLLLVSADFLASDYCYDIEMKKAMERHEAGEARVIPVIVRDCDLEHSPFSKLNYLPTDGKPVTNPRYWSTRDEAFRNVAEGLRRAVDELVESQMSVLSEKLSKAESLRNWPNVIDLGERILKMIPDHEPTRARTAAAYIKKWSRYFDEGLQDVFGRVELKTKRHEDREQVRQKIITDLHRAIALEPNNAEYYYLRFSLGGEKSDIEQAIALDPSTPQYHLARGDRQRASDLGWEKPSIPGLPPVIQGFTLDETWDFLRNPPKPMEFKERWRLKCLRD